MLIGAGFSSSFQSEAVRSYMHVEKNGDKYEAGVTSNVIDDRFSPSLMSISALKGQASAVPDIRDHEVQELRQTIAQGEYRRAAADIAGAMFNDSLWRE